MSLRRTHLAVQQRAAAPARPPGPDPLDRPQPGSVARRACRAGRPLRQTDNQQIEAETETSIRSPRQRCMCRGKGRDIAGRDDRRDPRDPPPSPHTDPRRR
jgi:hypothetical protein